MFEVVRWPRSPWSIFDELESLQSTWNRPAGDADGDIALRRRRPAYPLMNVWSGADGIVVDAELPGVDSKDIDISVQGDELTVRGKVNIGQAAEGVTYYRRERPAGEFIRTLQLPFRADSGAVKAAYKNGILRISVPRHEAEKPRKVAVAAE